MKYFATILLAAFSAAFIPHSHAKETSPTGAQIAAFGEAYAAAFDKGDATAVAEFWLPDGDYVDQFGNRFSGRDAIQKLFEKFFAENKGAQVRIDSESLRVVNPDLALEDGTSAVLIPGEPLPSRARFANTLVRKDGRWFLASVRESGFAPPDRSSELGPLSSLIGEWHATTPSGEEIILSVAPAPGGNFLLARRTVVAGGGPVAGGDQWIAWDPAGKKIRSWNFESDGGFGESLWQASEKGWTVESKHTLRDGDIVKETQSLTPDDKGNLVVKTLAVSQNEKELPKPEDLIFSQSENR